MTALSHFILYSFLSSVLALQCLHLVMSLIQFIEGNMSKMDVKVIEVRLP